MISCFEFILGVLAFLIAASIYWYLSIPKNLPPGPPGLPFVGSALELWDGTKQHLILQEYVKKYGPIFKVYIANQLVVVLGTYEAIQEALVKQGDIFTGRPRFHSGTSERLRGYGIILSEGDIWKEHRRFALSAFRDFGVGRPIIEQRTREELDYLAGRIKEYAINGQPFDPYRLVPCAVFNITSQILFGRRFSYDDKDFMQQFFSLSRRISGGVSFLSPFVFSKTLASMMTFVPVVKDIAKGAADFADYVEIQMKMTQATYDPDAEPNNYIHAFMKSASSDKNLMYFNDTQLLATCVDLFIAGMETTATSIRWAILYLSHHPEIQEKLYQEIKAEIGASTLPTYADRAKLPFAEAVIMETQRLADVIPMGLMRRPVVSTKVMGYDIPDNAAVLPLLTNILHNSELYPDPLKFDPGRFLDLDGKVIRDPKLIPFQAGKRICLGEGLARMELFLILIGLMSRYRFYFPEDKPAPTTDPIVGFICSPHPYDICVAARSD